jgi:hypothetical protein
MKSLLVIFFLVVLPASVCGQPVTFFIDNFESDLSKWTGTGDGGHNAVIVTDPVTAGNHAIRFEQVNDSGDIFSIEFSVNCEDTYVLSFDYLGFELPGSPADNYGGTVGISDATPADHRWLTGTIVDNNIILEMTDDNTWHNYRVEFRPCEMISITNGTIRIMVEDWNGAGCSTCPAGVPGDAYFDNFRLERLQPVPTRPASWGMIKSMYQ